MPCNLASLQATRKVALAFRMHDVCVRTVQTYGSGVWATACALTPERVVRNEMESDHLQFMHRGCRLRQNVLVWAMYAELGRLPLHYYWWREVVRLWKSTVALPEGSIWRDILRDNNIISIAAVETGLANRSLSWLPIGMLVVMAPWSLPP